MKVDIKVTFGQETKFLGWFGDRLKIRLNTRPEKGKANKELISFFAEQLGVPQNMIEIVSGHTSQLKTIELPDLSYEILISLIP